MAKTLNVLLVVIVSGFGGGRTQNYGVGWNSKNPIFIIFILLPCLKQLFWLIPGGRQCLTRKKDLEDDLWNLSTAFQSGTVCYWALFRAPAVLTLCHWPYLCGILVFKFVADSSTAWLEVAFKPVTFTAQKTNHWRVHPLPVVCPCCPERGRSV